MMVMPKCKEPSPSAKAAQGKAKSSGENEQQQAPKNPNDPIPYQKQIYPVDSFYQKLVDI